MLITRREIRIEWGDCDPADIVYFPNYFRWFDNNILEHFENAGLPKKVFLQRYNLVGFPLVDTRAQFHIPSSYGDRVTIETSIPQFGRSSFQIEHKLLRGKDVAVESQEKRVLVGRDPDTGKLRSVPVPAEVIALFNAAG